MRSIRPAAGADRDIQLDVEPSKLLHERVVVTLRIRDQARRSRSVELVLTRLEARELGHMLLDAANPSRLAREDD
jgi:hypothetical protein